MVADDSCIYIFAGFVTTERNPGQQGMTGDYELWNDFWKYNTYTGLFTDLSSDDAPAARCSAAVGITGDGKITVSNGKSEDNNNNHGDTWQYDRINRQWQNTNAMGWVPCNLSGSSYAVVNGDLYVYGGREKHLSDGYQVDRIRSYVYKYCADANSWTYLGEHPDPKVERGAGASYGDVLYAFGGKINNNDNSNRLNRFDPETGEWIDLTPGEPGDDWPSERSDALIAVVGDNMNIAGGYNLRDLRDQWNYNCTTGEMTRLDDIPEDVQLRNSVAVTGPNGDGSGSAIYYFGGEKNNEPLDNFYKLEEGEKWSKFDKQGKRWKRVGTESVFLNMSVEPAEALDNGCNVEPGVGEHEYDEGTIVDLKATENIEKGWAFLNWTGVPGGTSKSTLVTMNEDKDAVAHFKEIKLVVTGRLDTIFCRCDIEDQSKTVNLTRMTALGDDWMVNSLTINALEGSGDEVNQISSVFVTFGNTMIAEGNFTEDDGSITLTLDPAISIPENETYTVAIHYEFKNINQEVLEEKVLEFKTEVNAHGSPVHFDNGLIEGKGNGEVSIGRVWNTNDDVYPSIYKAMTHSEFSKLMLCPEEYKTTISFENSYTLQTHERYGDNLAKISSTGTTITVSAYNATIKRVIIQSSSGNCITTEDPPYAMEDPKKVNLSLESCTLFPKENGILWVNRSNLLIKDCSFVGGSRGIMANSANQIDISNSHFGIGDIGLDARFSEEIKVSNCSFTSYKDGMYLEHSNIVELRKVICDENKYGISLSVIDNFQISQSSTSKNQDYGLSMIQVNNFRISSCKINNNDHPRWSSIGTGIRLHCCTNGLINDNQLMHNCTAISMEESKNIHLSGNKISNSSCWFTGISLDNASPTLKGNKISNNHGAGILATNGAEPLIVGNNIEGNTIGVENQDPTVQLQASGNYWGTNNGPGEQDISGVINVDEWLNSQVELVASFGADTLFLLPRSTDTITLYLNNLESETDLLQVSWSDEQGWIQGDVRGTVEIDGTGGSQEIQLNTPGEDSPANHLAILAQSINEPDRTVRDTVVLVTYHPELSIVKAFPDSIMLGLGDSLQLTATGYDQHNYIFEAEWEWATTSGTVDPQGLLVCPETDGEITVTLRDRQTGLDTQVRFYCTNEEETVQNIQIKPRLDSLVPEMSISFDLSAWNQFGFPTNCQPEWTCEGGSIDQFGSYSAGDELGWFTITATDPNSGATGTCQVKIVTALGKQQVQLNQNILIYPNPANNYINISNLPYTVEEIHIILVNTLGQKVLDKYFTSCNKETISLDISDLPKGLFIVQIDTNIGRHQARFIKE